MSCVSIACEFTLCGPIQAKKNAMSCESIPICGRNVHAAPHIFATVLRMLRSYQKREWEGVKAKLVQYIVPTSSLDFAALAQGMARFRTRPISSFDTWSKYENYDPIFAGLLRKSVRRHANQLSIVTIHEKNTYLKKISRMALLFFTQVHFFVIRYLRTVFYSELCCNRVKARTSIGLHPQARARFSWQVTLSVRKLPAKSRSSARIWFVRVWALTSTCGALSERSLFSCTLKKRSHSSRLLFWYPPRPTIL